MLVKIVLWAIWTKWKSTQPRFYKTLKDVIFKLMISLIFSKYIYFTKEIQNILKHFTSQVFMDY